MLSGFQGHFDKFFVYIISGQGRNCIRFRVAVFAYVTKHPTVDSQPTASLTICTQTCSLSAAHGILGTFPSDAP